MYDTRLTNIDLSIDSILEKITEYDIYRYYIGQSFKLGRIMKSPFRQDKHPSFGIFKSTKYGTLLFKDLATGKSGNCVQFVQELFNISYRESLVKILNDLSNNNLISSIEGISVKEEYQSTSVVISVSRKKFCKTDDTYWNQYFLERSDLRHFNVSPIETYWINEIVQPWTYNVANPGYSYQIYNKYKIYKPLANKKEKWISNCNSYDIQGFEQLEYQGDLLIITKSLKDVMVLYKMGYNAIAPHGENHLVPKYIIDNIKKRFNNIFIFYDNDEAGIKGSKNLSTKTNFKTIYVPKQENTCKDISDFVQINGIKKGKELMKEILCEN
jgi:DNA primase